MEETLLLEQRLNKAFDHLKISLTQKSSLETYLNLIKLKDKTTYCHCVRVALCGIKAAGLLHLDPKALFYSGLLHDIGKALVDKELLSKAGDFSEQDYRKMKRHSLYGYYLLRGVHDFSAEIILRHHRYISEGYPKRLPRSKISYSETDKKLIEHYAKVLAIIDFYDAASTRKNKKFREKSVRKLLVRHFPAEIEMINICYDKLIFDL